MTVANAPWASGPLRLGVAGAGLMGRGIAQVALQAGMEVMLHDKRPGAWSEARAHIENALESTAARGHLSQDAARSALGRLHDASSLQAMAGCAIVIEAIVESLPAKQALMQALEEVVSDGCILATNTSSLLVTEVASACRHPSRVGGLHFFSPVPRMRVTEVIAGARTEPWVVPALEAFSQRLGHTPVRAQDTPGFIVNHAGRAYGPEAVRIASEGIADFQVIDAILRDACGFRMGPFELFDLTGLDVSHPAGESIYRQFYEEPRFRPALLLRQRLAAGLLGRKSGGGFYAAADQQQSVATAPVVPAPLPTPSMAVPVWLSAVEDARHGAGVRSALSGWAAALETGPEPSAQALCLVTPVGEDTTTTALAQGLDPARTVAVDPLFFGARHATLMTCPATLPAFRDQARALFARGGRSVAVVHDSPGFVAQRVLAAIVNVACDMALQGIARPADIDRAVVLALGYPRGPFAWGDALGAGTVLRILNGLYDRYLDPRYRPSAWLSRRAALGLPLGVPDG